MILSSFAKGSGRKKKKRKKKDKLSTLSKGNDCSILFKATTWGCFPCVYARARARARVCVRERRERERERVCVCPTDIHKRLSGVCVELNTYVCVRERERESVCVSHRRT